jgi:catechol 2,3-dioxygenase-like lactoylglutathione lyase family enzyme
MINGAHVIIYSQDADADRAFLQEVLGLTGVDAGGGWLIFGLPPAEVAVHPADEGGRQELYLMCEDVAGLVATLSARDVPCAPITDQRWGLLTEVTLPSGAKLGVYEPRHARPAPPRAAGAAPRAAGAAPRAARAAPRSAPRRRATNRTKAKKKTAAKAGSKKKKRR